MGQVRHGSATTRHAVRAAFMVSILETSRFLRQGRIECGLLSGLSLRLFGRPRADMEISMIGSKSIQRAAGLVAPNWFSRALICSIISHIVSVFSLRLTSYISDEVIQPLMHLDPDNLCFWSAWPKADAPSCSPMRWPLASLACGASAGQPSSRRPHCENLSRSPATWLR